MKTLFFLFYFITFSTSLAFAESKKVFVGNPNSRNSIQINQFYVINRPSPELRSETIIIYPQRQNNDNYYNQNNNRFFSTNDTLFEEQNF